MKELPEQSPSRRQFLLAGGRLLGLGGLGAYVAGQAFKRRRLVNNPNCVKLSTCQDCLELARCTKPKAQRFRISQASLGSGSSS